MFCLCFLIGLEGNQLRVTVLVDRFLPVFDWIIWRMSILVEFLKGALRPVVIQNLSHFSVHFEEIEEGKTGNQR
jgi:hypothetical protein